MKITEVIIEDQEGNEIQVPIRDYRKGLVEQHDVKPYKSDAGDASPSKVVEHIIEAIANGKDVDEGISDEYPDLVSVITNDIERTKASAKSAKEKAEEEKARKEAEKEAQKKAEEEKRQLTLAKQDTFVTNISKGADLAASEFVNEMKELVEGLPEGISVEQRNGGYGLKICENTTSENIGSALGYMMQSQINNNFIGNQLHFFIGDLVSASVEQGIYETANEANKLISKLLEEKHGKRLSVGNIDAYKRMAERTPVELRNPRADATAYLAISNMKLPRKGDGESQDDFSKRLAAFEADRQGLQKKLAEGEVISRKEILKPVEDVLVKHGIKEKASGPVTSIATHLAIFFHATVGLEELLSTHEEGVAVYVSETAETKTEYKLTKEQLESLRAESYAALVNSLYSTKKHSAKDVFRGFVETVTQVPVTKDAEGNDVFEERKTKTPVYPAPFFDTSSTEETKSE